MQSCARDGDPSERPRERLLVLGARALEDHELVALVLGGGRSLQRARGLLEELGGLRPLSAALPHELAELSGLGLAGAGALAASFELGRRVEGQAQAWAEPLAKPADVIDFVRARLRGLSQEHFMVVGLDARQRVRLVRTVAIGSLAQVDVHPRELFRPLVRTGMHSCVLVHNHPSGDAEPSESDLALTQRMCEVGRLVGIPVLDHLVVSDDDATSLAALGFIS